MFYSSLEIPTLSVLPTCVRARELQLVDSVFGNQFDKIFHCALESHYHQMEINAAKPMRTCTDSVLQRRRTHILLYVPVCVY